MDKGATYLSFGIRSNGTYAASALVGDWNKYIYPGYLDKALMYDIGECYLNMINELFYTQKKNDTTVEMKQKITILKFM